MITVNHLTFTYPGAPRPALKGLNFEIQQGEIFGFLGPSGSGKSTTQKILIGLLGGFQGQVEVLGRPVQNWGADLYEQIGVSFEQPNHFLKLTGLENLAYFSALYRRPALDPMKALEMVGLAEDARQPVGQYSKGMKNRLTFARALLHDPGMIFLDEPTSGLDPANAQTIKNIIREQQAAGKTIFLTTHNMSVVDELCDRAAFLVDGEIRLCDSPRTLQVRFGQRKVWLEHRTPDGMQRSEFALDGLADNPDFLALLRGGQVERLHTREASLEDIFIQVTGRGLA